MGQSGNGRRAAEGSLGMLRGPRTGSHPTGSGVMEVL